MDPKAILDWNTIRVLAAKGAPLAEVTRAGAPGPSPPRPDGSFAAVALRFFVLIIVGVWIALALRKAAAIRNLPADARVELLQHGLTELKTICRDQGAADGPLRERCVEQAKLVLLLPECGSECRAVATPVLPRAHR
jgi:hypothetical protein